MSRKYSGWLVIAAGIALFTTHIVQGAWTFASPSPDQNKNQGMTVPASGGGEGATCFLYLRVTRDGTTLNDGDGSYNGTLLMWSGSVAPPSGGFGTGGDEEVRVWKSADNPDTDPPLCTQDITFTS